MNTKQTVVLASNNKGKLTEMQALLHELPWDIQPQGNFFTAEAEETGLSFIENAILKARFASDKTGLPAIADDSGLEVTALKGQPGIYSARYGLEIPGKAPQDTKNNQKLLQKMAQIKNRQACYYCAMVYVRFATDPTPVIGLGQWCGELLTAPRGEGGFGYDPLIWLPSQQCSVAELPAAKKNTLSHRAKALKNLIEQLHVSQSH